MIRKEKIIFYLETFILTLSFVMVIMFLSRMYEKSFGLALESARRSDAVILSANMAECLKSVEDEEDLVLFLEKEFGMEKEGDDYLVRFDRDLQPDENGEYTISVAFRESDGYKEALIRAFYNDRELYVLETASYREDGHD
ncbi:MAG: hypothetical protein IKF68_05645 [Erysipelotrichaceae bacterium]|nr:hypothetical protein [Erysipelotrichaceae bacterium]